MKRYIVMLSAVSIMAACGGNDNANTNSDSTTSSESGADATDGDVSQNPDYQKGLALIGSSDCLTCHKVSEKLVGPAYQDVANKYAGQDTAITYLAHRIINGVGPDDPHNWGNETNNAVMTPHPQVSQPDAEQMVKYVLLLKTK